MFDDNIVAPPTSGESLRQGPIMTLTRRSSVYYAERFSGRVGRFDQKGLFVVIVDAQSGVVRVTKDREPPFAFEMSMISESCNSHLLSHLTAFFIDARAE